MPISVTSRPPPVAPAFGRLRDGWPVLLGIAVLYGPTYLQLAREVWQKPEAFHGALFFALAAWMVWARRGALLAVPAATRPILGGLAFICGLFLYVVGRSQDFLLLQVVSQIPLFVGLLLVLKGIGALRALWFPVAFIAFMVPLPGSLLDALLLPLKDFVSAVVDHGLHALGYPIARNGVVLTIGAYQLLIADACAGLNSIIALSGIGLAFMYLAGYTRLWQNATLIASLLPIAIFANVLRVACLTLITYHFGDELGQRFHDMAGMAEVLFALGMFFALDALLTRISQRRSWA